MIDDSSTYLKFIKEKVSHKLFMNAMKQRERFEQYAIDSDDVFQADQQLPDLIETLETFVKNIKGVKKSFEDIEQILSDANIFVVV